MQKIGINLHAIKGFSDEEYIEKIASLGFNSIFTSTYDLERHIKIAEYCQKYGVSYEFIHAPFDNINDIWFDGTKGENVLSELIRCVDICSNIGVKTIIVHLSSGEKAPAPYDIGRERFYRLVKYAANKNVLVAFENQRKIYNIAWALETFCEKVSGFCWDVGHENCFTPGREYMPLFGNRIICTHIHDNSGVYNRDDHLIPFDGNINFYNVADTLVKNKFNGTLMLEVFCENSNKYEGYTPEKFLQRAANAAKRLAKMVEEKRNLFK